MKAENCEILKSLHAQRTTRSTTSALFHHMDLIRDVWEVGNFGVPGVVEALRLAGATSGISTTNVQGFVKRCQKRGLLGRKGSRSQELAGMFKEEGLSEQKIQAASTQLPLSGKSEAKSKNPSRRAKDVFKVRTEGETFSDKPEPSAEKRREELFSRLDQATQK